jgi:hypothetical protein
MSGKAPAEKRIVMTQCAAHAPSAGEPRPTSRGRSIAASVRPAWGAIACVAVWASGCGSPSKTVVGVSSAPTTAPAGEDAGAPLTPTAATPIPADFRTTFVRVNAAPVVSHGHAGGRYTVNVYVNRAGEAAYRADRGEVPEGTQLIKEHFEAAGETARPGPVMMMEKRPRGFDVQHGNWRYVVVDSAGANVAEGAIEGCAGCHDDAAHDHIFRLP